MNIWVQSSMVKVFISYSSKDSDFITKLTNDLRKKGFEVWLDKWEIRVGDDIFEKIQLGIRNSDYVILVLCHNSVSSGWVDKEWKIVYWNEITSGKVRLLPTLLEDCDVPEFLKIKKYADFRKGYENGFEELLIPLESTTPLSIRKENHQKRVAGPSRVEVFKEFYDYAYSLSGMNMSREEARDFALKWLEQHYDKDFNRFKEFYDYAYSLSGMNMSREEAKDFALRMI